MLHFRRATEVDVNIIALLGRVTFSESHGNFIHKRADLVAYLDKSFTIEQIKKELLDAKNFFWIAFSDDFPIGYAKLVIDSKSEFLDSESVCRLERIYILNDFLHLKVGHHLQDLMFKKALELKYEWIWLTVYIKNYKAINFYTKSEYKHVGNIDFSISVAMYDNIVFAKKLT